MTTVTELVSRSRRMLRGSHREHFNVLSEDVPDTQDFLLLDHVIAPITVGDYLGLGAEIVLVTSVETVSNKVNVMRGVDDTPVPTTQPMGTRVEVAWRWFTADLVGYLADEIRSWPDGIFTVRTTGPLSVPTSARTVDLSLTRFRFPLSVLARRSGRTEWVDVPAGDLQIQRNLPISEFPSGTALKVSSRWHASQIILDYASAFDIAAIDDLTTDVATVGLEPTLFDAAVYGVAWRALAGEEGDRSNDTAQPEPRTAEEVDPFDAMRAASAYKAIRDLRLEEEKRRLRQLYPLKVA